MNKNPEAGQHFRPKDERERVGEEECSRCGNAKSLRSCQVCRSEMMRLDAKTHTSRNRELSDEPTSSPEDSTTPPIKGWGQQRLDETKRRLGIGT